MMIKRICFGLALVAVYGLASSFYTGDRAIFRALHMGDTLSPAQRLVLAYPDHLERTEGNLLIWKDGTRMIVDDSVQEKDRYTLNNMPDLEDQFTYEYKRGIDYDTPCYDYGPGTIRYEPFFKKMYGQTKAEVEKNLVTVDWLPSVCPIKLKVTTVNNIHKKIQTISKELEKRKDLHKYLNKPAGVFNWRYIHGTTQMSMHSFGMAIDINVKYSNYWRWEKPDSLGNYPYKNKIPFDIVEVFEKQGFIWGGKWYRYDTMHFEYRPEMMIY